MEDTHSYFSFSLAMAAANKVSNKGIQRDLNEARKCKCENTCIDCFKLKSELNEVRLEFKSVKEIVNILNRDLATIDVLVHSLHEQDHLILLHNHLKTGLRDILQRRVTGK